MRPLLTLTLVLLAAAPLHAQLTFQTVALSGTQAPGQAAGVLYGTVFSFPLAGPGGVSFANTLTGAGVTTGNDTSLWAGAAGSVSLLAREANAAPGTTVNYSSFTLASAPDALSRTGFSAVLTGAGVTATNDLGIWMGAPSSVALALREGDAAPGTGAGVTFAFLGSTPSFNTGERLAVFGTLTGPGVTGSNNTGLWSGTTAGVSLLARTGDVAPGTPVAFTSFATPRLNASGQAAFEGTLTGTGVTTANDNGFWFGTPGSLALLAREGDAAPGLAGVSHANLGSANPVLNGAGQLAFFSGLTGAGVTTANDEAIFHGTPGALQVLAREGDAAPGAGAGVNHGSISSQVLLNGTGDTLFNAFRIGTGIGPTNDSAVYLGTSGSVEKIYAEGDAAPGLGAGVLFGTASTAFALNDAGLVAFINTLRGTGVTTANDVSLWWADGSGTLGLVVREGSPFEVTPGVFRTISGMDFDMGAAGEEGSPGGLSDAGLLSFRLTFTDASVGVFTTQLVPEPGSALLLGMGTLGLLARRRRGKAEAVIGDK